MRQARYILLIVLALVLPVRGAVAGALMCPGHAAGVASGSAHHGHEAQRGEHHHAPGHVHGGPVGAGHVHGSPVHGGDAHEQAHGAVGSSGDADTALPAAHADPADGGHCAGATCLTCAASCSASPLAMAAPALVAPAAAIQLDFPALHPPAPSHASSGQDRPPRRC